MPDWAAEIRNALNQMDVDPARQSEIIEELSQCLTDRYDELLAKQMSETDAIALIRQDLNSGKLLTGLESVFRPASPQIALGQAAKASILAELWQNFRYSIRLLRLNPGFALVVILSLGLGIGANTAIFQLLNAIRLRTLPVANPQELVSINTISAHGKSGHVRGLNAQLTTALWESIQAHQHAFSEMCASYLEQLNLSQGGEARLAQGMFVSGTFFETLGIQPILGRLISNADDQKNSASVAVISESFWRREFGGDPSVIGKVIHLEKQPFSIIGVSPAKFFGIEVGKQFDVAIPLSSERIVHSEHVLYDDPRGWWLAAIARLKPGWTFEKASAHLAAISPGIFRSTIPPMYDAVNKKNYVQMRLQAVPAGNGISLLRNEYQNPLWLLLAISGFVLVIACANLANLMIARASARQREIAIRLSLGASRGRLLRQMLTESLLLACIAGVFAVFLAQVLSRIMVSLLMTEGTTWFLNLELDWHVILFIALLTTLTCMLFGLAPAIQSANAPLGEVMKAHGRSSTANRSHLRLRRGLVITQVALSLVLVVGAFLFVRTLRNLLTLDAGMNQEQILITTFDLASLQLPEEQRAAYKQQLLDRVRQIPGVLSDANANVIPLSGFGWNDFISFPERSIHRQLVNFNQVSSRYFHTVGTRFLLGRDFDSRDKAGSPKVAIVTTAFVKRFLKTANPIGVHMHVIQSANQPDVVYEIIGMVQDTKYEELREDFSPIVFLAESQDDHPDQYVQMLIRSNVSASSLIPSIKRETADLNPGIVLTFEEFRQMIREGLLRERMMATLAGIFGFLAAILAMIGLYGVISYMVVQRRNEIGIRIALGANRSHVLLMIVREAMILVASGVTIGVILVFITSGAAKSLIFGMQPNDFSTLLLSIVILTIVAFAASLFPARQAAMLNPTEALRDE
jgi:putative ABC transport system permease protein